MLDYILALGAYEKQVILELDKLPAYRGAHLYKDKYGARILFCIITDSWERKHTVQACLLNLHITSLLLLRGFVPPFDAIANLTHKLTTEATTIREVLSP